MKKSPQYAEDQYQNSQRTSRNITAKIKQLSDNDAHLQKTSYTQINDQQKTVKKQ